MSLSKIAAFKTSRRSVAVAVFEGTKLDYTQIRHLSSDHQRAEDSAVGFARWVVDKLDIESAVLDGFSDGDPSRRAILNLVVRGALRSASVSVWQVPKDELLNAFSIPRLKNNKELRSIITSFWPILDDQRQAALCMDAAALGLYVATERFFLP